MDSILWILLAFAPLILVAVYLGRDHPRALLFGGAGWILALVLRIIPLRLFQSVVLDIVAVIIYSAILAGLFEEITRFWLVRRTKLSDSKQGMTFGLGWGIAEALVIFIPSVLFGPTSLFTNFMDILPGVLERYVAVLAHIAFTFIIIRGMQYREYVIVAIAGHAVLDFIAGMTYYVMRLSVWQVEGLVALYTLMITAYSIYILKKVY
ncbi:MAG: YhfC family glutamic-type intramembrane protease [Candidatus Methanomethylicaceae archaeon]